MDAMTPAEDYETKVRERIRNVCSSLVMISTAIMLGEIGVIVKSDNMKMCPRFVWACIVLGINSIIVGTISLLNNMQPNDPQRNHAHNTLTLTSIYIFTSIVQMIAGKLMDISDDEKSIYNASCSEMSGYIAVIYVFNSCIVIIGVVYLLMYHMKRRRLLGQIY